ncbi:hypothetical protein [Streptomyces tibetensis]|uniref:hypothetical protein n=1 Tax=Streptomyces tibetensis TaxID=2382123 RepID=UPI00340B2363
MTDRLTPQNVTVTTATIEVKALTLGKRQITQSVFRQLVEEPLIDDNGSFRGQPWGYINHCPDKKVAHDNLTGKMIDCATGPVHRHVVWQKGDELRRSRIIAYRPPYYGVWSDTTDLIVQAGYCTNNHEMPAWITSRRSDEFAFQQDGVRCTGAAPKRGWEVGHECATAAMLERARADLTEEIAQERVIQAARKSAWEAVVALPQLFIAV